MKQTDYISRTNLTEENVKNLIKDGWNLIAVNTIKEKINFNIYRNSIVYHFVKYEKSKVNKIK